MEWAIPYRAVTRGEAWIEADTAEEAENKFEQGAFELDPGEELVDWESVGDAKEVV